MKYVFCIWVGLISCLAVAQQNIDFELSEQDTEATYTLGQSSYKALHSFHIEGTQSVQDGFFVVDLRTFVFRLRKDDDRHFNNAGVQCTFSDGQLRLSVKNHTNVSTSLDGTTHTTKIFQPLIDNISHRFLCKLTLEPDEDTQENKLNLLILDTETVRYVFQKYFPISE